eukprot:COSAG06_NODE_10021_length_1766_cov_595.694661_2_plen_96_part_01
MGDSGDDRTQSTARTPRTRCSSGSQLPSECEPARVPPRRAKHRVAAAALPAARKRNAPSSLSTTDRPHDVNFNGHCTRHSARTHVSSTHRSASRTA